MKKNTDQTGFSFCQWEITTACNMNCAGCRVPQGASEQPRIDIALRSADDLIVAGITNLEIIGGEPLIYEHLPTLLKYLNQRKEIRRFAVLTNATMTNKLQEIKPELSFEKGGLAVSINYSEEQCKKFIESGTDVAMAKKSLAGWQALREFGNHCSVRVNCVINSLNIASLPEIARQVINMGGTFSFCPLVYRRQNYDSGLDFTFRSSTVGLAPTEEHKEAMKEAMAELAMLKKKHPRKIIPTEEYMKMSVEACKDPNEPYKVGCKGKGIPYLRVSSKIGKSLRDGKIAFRLKACSDVEGSEVSKLVTSDLRDVSIRKKLLLIYQNDPEVIRCNSEERCIWSVTHIREAI
ncbi:MAG: radical SAM protein [Minisyncoccia bacterium]